MYQVQCARGHWMQIPGDAFGQRLLCPDCHTYVSVAMSGAGHLLEPKYEFQCRQGHQLRVKAKYLGREVRCPTCQALVPITPKAALGLPAQVEVARPLEEGQPWPPALPAELPAATTPPQPPPKPVLPPPPVLSSTRTSSINSIPVAFVETSGRRPFVDHEETDEDDPEEDRRDRVRHNRHVTARGFRIIATGLGLIKFAIVAGLFCGLCAILSAIGAPIMLLLGDLGRALAPLYAVFLILSIIVAALAMLGGMVGIIMQLFVPYKSGAWWLALTTLALMIFAPVVVILIAFVFASWMVANGGAGAIALQIVAFFINSLIGLSPWICFILYLRSLATFLRRRSISSEANFLISLVVGTVYGSFFAGLVLGTVGVAVPILGALLGIFFIIMAFVVNIMIALRHIYILNELRDTIQCKY